MCVCIYVICMLRDKIWEWPGDEAMYVCCYTGQLEWLCSHCKLSDIMVIGLGQPAKPQPSLVPAIINITWPHRTIHYFHLCMYAFHWVQGSCCAGIESPRDTKLSPGLCSSLTKKSQPPVRRLRYDSLIPRLSSSGGRESLGTRLWRLDRAAYGGCTLTPSLHSDIIQVYLVKFWHNTRKSECIKPLPRLQEPPDWLTARAQHYLIRNFI